MQFTDSASLVTFRFTMLVDRRNNVFLFGFRRIHSTACAAASCADDHPDVDASTMSTQFRQTESPVSFVRHYRVSILLEVFCADLRYYIPC